MSMKSSHASNSNGNGDAEGNGRKKKRRLTQRRKRVLDPSIHIDYKNHDLIKRFITERGKIIPCRISGASQTQQRQIALAVKRARFLALIPSSANHRVEKGFAGRVQAVLQTFSSSSARMRPRQDRYTNRSGERASQGEEKASNQEKEMKAVTKKDDQ